MMGRTYDRLAVGDISEFTKTVSEADVYMYAGISGDLNPAHINEEYARAAALIDNLAGQWLYTRQLPELSPDPELFPTFTDSLRDAMKHEVLLLVDDIVDTGLTLQYLLRNLQVRKPASLSLAALLIKDGARINQVQSAVQIYVDLGDELAKGIHMSRLYLLLDEHARHPAPAASAEEITADEVLRLVRSRIRQQRAHEFVRRPTSDLHGATVGIVGFGGIGSAIGRKAKALGMRVVATRRRQNRRVSEFLTA